MIAFPNGKINLGLNVLRKRSDGFHELETIFYPIALRDIVEVIPGSSFQLIRSGMPIDGDDNENLCVRAYQLLLAKFPGIPPASLYLHKHIPMAAGLGGGSSDAAFTLQLLNQQFSLGLSHSELTDLALNLGSDCPFFISNRPCVGRGRGELLEPVRVNLDQYAIVIIHPGIFVSTRWAYSKISPLADRKPLKEIIALPPERWKDELVNDFEEPISKVYPMLSQIRKDLYQSGAVYAAMSGSGSAMFGIFHKARVGDPGFLENYRDHAGVYILS